MEDTRADSLYFVRDNRDDWQLHQDGDCAFDCPFCSDFYGDEEDPDLGVWDDEY